MATCGGATCSIVPDKAAAPPAGGTSGAAAAAAAGHVLPRQPVQQPHHGQQPQLVGRSVCRGDQLVPRLLNGKPCAHCNLQPCQHKAMPEDDRFLDHAVSCCVLQECDWTTGYICGSMTAGARQCCQCPGKGNVCPVKMRAMLPALRLVIDPERSGAWLCRQRAQGGHASHHVLGGQHRGRRPAHLRHRAVGRRQSQRLVALAEVSRAMVHVCSIASSTVRYPQGARCLP